MLAVEKKSKKLDRERLNGYERRMKKKERWVRRTKILTFWFLMIVVMFPCVMGRVASAEEERVTVKLYAMPDSKETDAFSQANLAVIRAFKDKYPYIDLEPFSGIKIRGGTEALLAIAGGNSTDIISVNWLVHMN